MEQKNPLRAVSRVTDSWTGSTPLFSRPPGAPPPVHPQHSGAPNGKFEVSGNCHGVTTFETFVVVALLGITHTLSSFASPYGLYFKVWPDGRWGRREWGGGSFRARGGACGSRAHASRCRLGVTCHSAVLGRLQGAPRPSGRFSLLPLLSPGQGESA